MEAAAPPREKAGVVDVAAGCDIAPDVPPPKLNIDLAGSFCVVPAVAPPNNGLAGVAEVLPDAAAPKSFGVGVACACWP